MKIRPAGAELFHPNRRTDMTKVTFAFCNCANAPKNKDVRVNIQNAVWTRILRTQGCSLDAHASAFQVTAPTF